MWKRLGLVRVRVGPPHHHHRHPFKFLQGVPLVTSQPHGTSSGPASESEGFIWSSRAPSPPAAAVGLSPQRHCRLPSNGGPNRRPARTGRRSLGRLRLGGHESAGAGWLGSKPQTAAAAWGRGPRSRVVCRLGPTFAGANWAAAGGFRRDPAACFVRTYARRCFRQVSRSRTLRADVHVRAKARRRRRMTPRERAPQTRPRRDPSAPDPSRPRLKARGASFGAQGSLDQEPKARQGANSQAEGGGAEDPAIFSDNCGRSAGGAAHRVRVGAVHGRETAFLANARRGAWHRSSALSRHSAPAA